MGRGCPGRPPPAVHWHGCSGMRCAALGVGDVQGMGLSPPTSLSLWGGTVTPSLPGHGGEPGVPVPASPFAGDVNPTAVTAGSVHLGAELEMGRTRCTSTSLLRTLWSLQPGAPGDPDCFHGDFTAGKEWLRACLQPVEQSRATTQGGMVQGCCRATDPSCNPSAAQVVTESPWKPQPCSSPPQEALKHSRAQGCHPGDMLSPPLGGAELSPPCSWAVVRGGWIGKETLGKRLLELRAVPRGCSWWLQGDDGRE